MIRADAELDRAVDAAVSSAFAYAGQTCVSLQRLYVEEAVAEETLARLAAAATALASGDPSAEDTVVGPLITTQATDRVRGWLAEAVAAGARIVAGGTVTNGVLAATVVTDVPDDSPLLREEVF